MAIRRNIWKAAKRTAVEEDLSLQEFVERAISAQIRAIEGRRLRTPEKKAVPSGSQP